MPRRANVKWFSTRQKRKRRGRKTPMQLVALRLNDLGNLFRGRYGIVLPDDDSGRDDVVVAVHHLVRLRGHEGSAERWIEVWAPWMQDDEAERIVAAAKANPQVWKADEIAVRLGVTKQERAMYGLTTIGAIDQTKEQRADLRREKDRLRKEQLRRAKGSKTRQEYLDEARKGAPWIEAGMSRATWYRQKQSDETGSAAA